MRILFTRFPLESAPHGGAENQTQWLTQGLKKLGHTVSFLGSCPVLAERFRALGAETETLDLGPPPVTKWGVLSFLWRRKRMQQQLIESISLKAQSSPVRTAEGPGGKLNTIMMLSLSEKLLLTQWAHERGINVLWVEHDRVGRWLAWNPWLSLLKKQSAFATMICVSELSKKKYVELGFNPENIRVIPNGVPIPAAPFATVPAADPLLRIGCIARLSPEKGVVELLQATADIQGITLNLLGHGPDEGYIRKIIIEDEDRLHMPRIRLRTSVEDLETFYASIDLLVLPSVDHDPFGLVAAEAMVRGIAVIVTDACGIATDLRDGEDACIVRAGVEEDLRGAIVSLMDPMLRGRIALAGQRTAREKFSLGRMIKHYEDCIRKR